MRGEITRVAIILCVTKESTSTSGTFDPVAQRHRTNDTEQCKPYSLPTQARYTRMVSITEASHSRT